MESKVRALLKIPMLLLFLLGTWAFSGTGNVCRVLVGSISGTYAGGCKNGLAHGRGTAKGIDTYVGMFSEGLPHGKGTYTYANGNVFKGQFQDGMKHGSGEFSFTAGGHKMVQKGFWQHDEYVGNKKPEELFRVTENTNILSHSIKRVSETGNQIKISFYAAHTKYVPTNLEIKTSTGELHQESRDFSIYNHTFPNHISIRYSVISAGGLKVCALSFVIMTAGRFEVLIHND